MYNLNKNMIKYITMISVMSVFMKTKKNLKKKN